MDRTIVAGPPNPTTFGVKGTEWLIDQTFNSGRVRLMPSEYNNSNNSFQGSFWGVARALAGITGIAAAGPIVSLRWSDTASEFMVKEVRITAVITTAFTTAQPVDYDLIIARNFTVADTGGNAVTPIVTGNQLLRSKWMNPQSRLADLRDSSGAALTAGTRTLDAQALKMAAITQTNGLGSGGTMQILYKHDKMAGHPLMLQYNQGLIIRVVTAMGAAGVVKVYYEIEGAEVPGL